MQGKVRILVAVGPNGEWHAFGNSWGEGVTPDDELRENAYERMDGEVARFVWIEAEIPPPRRDQEILGVVAEETASTQVHERTSKHPV